MIASRWIVALVCGSVVSGFGQSRHPTIATIEELMREHHDVQALQAVNTSLRSSPGNPNLWTIKGIILSIEGKRTEALSAFDRALHLAPGNMAALRGEVELLDQKGDRRAVPLLHHILALSPHDPTAHEMLALYEERSGKCQAAIADFRESGDGMKQHPASIAAYGSCLHAIGNTQQAISIFQELVDRFPQAPYARYDLALVLCDAKDYLGALRVMEPVIRAGTTDPDLLSLASEAYEAVGNTPQSVATLRQAIVLDPKNVNLYNRFAELCLDHESYKVGVDMMDAGLRYNPKAASLYLSRGLLYAQISNFGEAQSDFATAERLDPGQGVSPYAKDIAALEKYHFDVSHSDAAVKALRNQIKSHPDSYLLHYLLAKLLTMQAPVSETANLVHARLEAEAAVHLKPNFVAGHDLLALVDLHSSNFTAAAEQSRDALQYDPDDRAAVYHLITALRHSKRSQDQAELQSMAKRLTTMERNSLQNDTHKRKFRLIESPPPPSEKDSQQIPNGH